MTARSTSCQCSACIHKYQCKDYSHIVEGQRFFNKFIDIHLRKGIIIRFQTEFCPYRKTEIKEKG
jgi:hypothetical protein